jgi:hypothetical protein
MGSPTPISQSDGARARVVVVAISSTNFAPIFLYRRVWGRGLSKYFAKSGPKLTTTKVAGPNSSGTIIFRKRK